MISTEIHMFEIAIFYYTYFVFSQLDFGIYL